ncbi:MAG: response regulator [Flavobacteriaceae bacterium]|nr:response regulator [Flavobacteriaceae bacterium]
MSTLISRLFAKDESIDVVHELIKEKRDSFLQYFISKSSSTKQIEELKLRIENHQYSENEFLANTEVVFFYLELEQYLVFKDPRYINTQKKLREESLAAHPELFKSEPFLPLLEIEKKQDTLFAYLFLKYLLNKLYLKSETRNYAKRMLASRELQEAPSSTLNIVERINLIQKYKSISENVKQDIVPLLSAQVVEDIYQNCYFQFKKSYPRFKTLRAIDDLIPSEENTVITETPVRKLVAINANSNPKSDDESIIERNKNIFENILDGFILINPLGKILYGNNTALKILNCQRNKFKGQSILDLLPREFSQRLNEDLLNSNSAKPNVVIGKRSEIIIKNQLEDVDYEISITTNYSEENQTYSVFLRNISDKKNMLETIREAQLQAERTAKVKSTFLSNMSHEIRTPLNVILGLTEIIKDGDLKDETMLSKNLDGIDFSAKNLLSIVNDILDFSKIEAGKLTLQSIDFNLRKVVENLTDGFEIKAREKGLDLVTKIHEDVPDIVIGDQYRLNQVLNNLIGNAIKFTKRGAIYVDVELVSSEEEEEEDINLRFSVRDTGIGITKDDLDRIFESFYQVQNSDNAGGTGLGLAITRELIYLQDGTFDAESELGKGSTFSCSIPYKKSMLKSMAHSVKTYVKKDKKLEGLKVLVAEDNQMNQFYIKQLLKKLKVEVDIAENGKEAVDIVSNKKDEYDLILMDMHMPVMSGIEAIEHIRTLNHQSIKKVPIVACSADVFPEARKNAIKAGIDFYLTKPLSEDAIKEVLFWLISDEAIEPRNKIENQDGMMDIQGSKNKNVALNMLLETFDNDHDFIVSLLEVFINTTPEDYKSLRKCIDREYYTRASSLAHKLKSSFMNLGMTVHGHHLQQIESNIIKRDGVEEAKKHLSAFNTLYTKALLEVNLLLIELRNN